MKKIIPLIILIAAMPGFAAQAQIVDIHTFNSTTGANPYGSLTRLGNILYGMTYDGGLYSDGCVFAVDTNGNNYRDLFDFHDSLGIEPEGSLLLANGFLYGMTTLGGSDNIGNMFRVDTGGHNYKNMIDFTGPNGRVPWGSLIMLGSNLYGMTEAGGDTFNLGVIFSIDTNGNNYHRIFSFHDSGTAGYGPEGDLTFVNGKFYGMTQEGGQYSDGIIFSVDTDGHNFKDLLDFWGNIAPMGEGPTGNLTYANGMLYGMTQQGGVDDYGVLFSVDTNGNGYKLLQDFTGLNGYDGVGTLLLDGATLYGMTFAGGANSVGNIFSIDTNGNNFSNLVSFNGNNGSSPAGALILANGILYGTTYEGGSGYGTVFSTNICTMRVSVFNQMPVSCYGGNTGQAVANISAGTSPYTFQWSGGGGTRDTASNLSAGIYTVTVVDNNGCSATTSDTISQPAETLFITDSVQNVLCFGASTGSITLSVSGNNPPYTYTWAQIATQDSTNTALTAGSYAVTVTDANGCTVAQPYVISQPLTPLTTLNDSIAQTGQLCNGLAAVTATGGTMPYSYLWQTGSQTTDTIKSQCAGNYCCVVTDNNGCTFNTCVTVNLGTGVSAISNATAIIAYPEPNDGYFTLEGINAGQVIEIYDCNGQKLSNSIAGNTTMHLNISDKANGIYLIRILSKDGTVISQTKVVKAQ